MIRRPPRSTHTDTLFPYTTRFRSVVGRICIDVLRSRSAKPEEPYGDTFPDFVVTEDEATPEGNAELVDSVGLALLVVLGSLRPDERLAFVLRSEESRVGNEGVRTGRSRWAPGF